MLGYLGQKFKGPVSCLPNESSNELELAFQSQFGPENRHLFQF